MATYFEESLEKLLKKHIINIVLSLQTEVRSNTKILKDVPKINDKVEWQLLGTKNVNSLLQQRVIELVGQCWANAQYSRRQCLEVAGIPESVKQNEFEDKVLRIFKKVGCAIFPVIIMKFAIMLEDIIMSSSNFRNGRIANRYFRLQKTRANWIWRR